MSLLPYTALVDYSISKLSIAQALNSRYKFEMFEANLEELVYPWDKVVEVKANIKKNLTNSY